MLLVDPEIGGVVKSLSYPNEYPILACLTDTNKLIFWDLGTYSKIQVRNFPENLRVFLVNTQPILVRAEGTLKLIEFKEQNIIETVTVTASYTSFRNNLLYIGMVTKLCSLNMSNFNMITQKNLDYLEKIIILKMNHNEKKLFVCGDYGDLVVLNAFTLEEFHHIAGLGERFVHFDYISGQDNIVVQAFEHIIHFGNLDTERRDYKELSTIIMEDCHLICFDLVEGCMVLALWSGTIVLLKVTTSKLYTVKFVVTDKIIRSVKFLFGARYLFITDTADRSFIVRLKGFANSSSRWFDPEFIVNQIFFHKKTVVEEKRQETTEKSIDSLRLSMDKTNESEKIEFIEKIEDQPVAATHIIDNNLLNMGMDTFLIFDDEGNCHTIEFPESARDSEKPNDAEDSNFMSYLRTHTVQVS